jgi:hypothetical protein
MTLILAPLLIAVSIWLYTLVFAFSCLWFVHYLLARCSGRGRARVRRSLSRPSPCRPSQGLPRAEAAFLCSTSSTPSP